MPSSADGLFVWAIYLLVTLAVLAVVIVTVDKWKQRRALRRWEAAARRARRRQEKRCRENGVHGHG